MVNNFTELSITEFQKEMLEDESIVIDARTPEELEQTGIIWGKDTLHIDVLKVDAWQKIQKLDKTKNYLIYCRSAGRTKHMQAYMQAEWFMYVKDLEGGIENWIKHKEKTIKL